MKNVLMLKICVHSMKNIRNVNIIITVRVRDVNFLTQRSLRGEVLYRFLVRGAAILRGWGS